MVSLEFPRENVVRLDRGHERGMVYLKLHNITFYNYNYMARGLKPSPGLRIGGVLKPPPGLRIGGGGLSTRKGF